MIVIFGGTFNPIHIGHQQILDSLQKINNIDKIFLIPTKIPPHKAVDYLADKSDRINMCKIVASRYTNVEVSTIELDREGKSYTIDTLTAFGNIFPNADIAITIGADMLVTFKEWKNYKAILKVAKIITFYREDTDVILYRKSIDELRGMDAEIIEIDDAIVGISSTNIRDSLKQGMETEFLNNDVLIYINEHKLYCA